MRCGPTQEVAGLATVDNANPGSEASTNGIAAELCNAFPLECSQGQVCHPVCIAAELFCATVIRLRPKRETGGNFLRSVTRPEGQSTAIDWQQLQQGRYCRTQPIILPRKMGDLPVVGSGSAKSLSCWFHLPVRLSRGARRGLYSGDALP